MGIICFNGSANVLDLGEMLEEALENQRIRPRVSVTLVNVTAFTGMRGKDELALWIDTIMDFLKMTDYLCLLYCMCFSGGPDRSVFESGRFLF